MSESAKLLPVLPYGSLLTRYGVIIEDVGDTVIVRVPSLNWYVYSKRWIVAFLARKFH